MGLKLVAQADDVTPPAGSRCRSGAPVREERIAAIAVDITLNRWGDHDPLGRMFALVDSIPAIRAEERRNAAARRGTGEPAVTNGLQGDAIQPLTLRARPGECVRIHLRNALKGEDASFHLHGSSLTVDGRPATAAEKAALVAPGRAATYEWQIFNDEPEGTHYFHSHGPHERAQASHGLFGALIVEPARPTEERDYALTLYRRPGRVRVDTTWLEARPGETVRLRLIDAVVPGMEGGPETPILVGAPATVAALDGRDLNAPRPLGPTRVPLGMGQRADLVFT